MCECVHCTCTVLLWVVNKTWQVLNEYSSDTVHLTHAHVKTIEYNIINFRNEKQPDLSAYCVVFRQYQVVRMVKEPDYNRRLLSVIQGPWHFCTDRASWWPGQMEVKAGTCMTSAAVQIDSDRRIPTGAARRRRHRGPRTEHSMAPGFELLYVQTSQTSSVWGTYLGMVRSRRCRKKRPRLLCRRASPCESVWHQWPTPWHHVARSTRPQDVRKNTVIRVKLVHPASGFPWLRHKTSRKALFFSDDRFLLVTSESPEINKHVFVYVIFEYFMRAFALSESSGTSFFQSFYAV